MARTTVGQTAQRIRRQLSSSVRFEVNVLATAMDAATDTVVLTYAPQAQLQAGSFIDIGLERMYVLDADTANKKLTVLRGYLDSEPEAHDVSDLIVVNARFDMPAIVDSMRDEILSWPPDIFTVDDDTFPVAGTLVRTATYELPVLWSDALRVLDVRHNRNVLDYTAITDMTWPRSPFRLQRGTPTGFDGASSSGLLLRLTDGLQGGNLYIQVARPFDLTEFELTTDLVTNCGLSESMLDLLTMGTKLRMMDDAEVARSARNAQDEPRRAAENPAGAQLSTQRSSFARYIRRRGEIVNELRMKYPVRGLQ